MSFKWKPTYGGIKKESRIANEEMIKCRKCGGKIEQNYPNGYLTQFTCLKCGEKRIGDFTFFFIYPTKKRKNWVTKLAKLWLKLNKK